MIPTASAFFFPTCRTVNVPGDAWDICSEQSKPSPVAPSTVHSRALHRTPHRSKNSSLGATGDAEATGRSRRPSGCQLLGGPAEVPPMCAPSFAASPLPSPAPLTTASDKASEKVLGRGNLVPSGGYTPSPLASLPSPPLAPCLFCPPHGSPLAPSHPRALYMGRFSATYLPGPLSHLLVFAQLSLP